MTGYSEATKKIAIIMHTEYERAMVEAGLKAEATEWLQVRPQAREVLYRTADRLRSLGLIVMSPDEADVFPAGHPGHGPSPGSG